MAFEMETGVTMTADLIDERDLPAMLMVWPIERLPSATKVAIPGGYIARTCLEPDFSAARTLAASEWPGLEEEWGSFFVDTVVPGGAILVVHAQTGQSVATAIAVHRRRGWADIADVGKICYIVVDPRHRGKGLGRAVTALAVGRLIEAGYRHIFLNVQGWRLPAIRCYLRLGFVPLLSDDDLVPRWRRICDQIGWPMNEQEWPQSLAAWSPGLMANGEVGEGSTPRKVTAYLSKFRRSLLERRVTFCRLIGNSLLLDIDRQPGDDSSGHVIWLDPVWQVWASGRVLVGSDFCLVQGEGDARVSGARGVTFDYMRSQSYPAAKYERAGALVGRLVGEPVVDLVVKPRSNDLTLAIGERFLVRTFLSDPTDDHTWHIDNCGRRVALYGSPRALEMVRGHQGEMRPMSRDSRQKRDQHAFNEDGMVLCNPRDREAAHRAEMEGIAADDRAAVTCRKCLALLYKRDKARREGR
jgi:mycothiol synthase